MSLRPSFKSPALLFTLLLLSLACLAFYLRLETAHTRISTLESISLKRERDATAQILDLDHQLRKVLLRFGNGDNATAADATAASLEQARRRQRVDLACQAHEQTRNLYLYKSKTAGGVHDQKASADSFLVEPRSRSLYCYVHKAASTTWMSLFARVYRDKDEAFVAEMERTGAYYKIKRRMSPPSYYDIWDRLNSGDYFSFLAVRHPMDRLLSAFRDRILNPCTHQAKNYVPRIFKHFGLPNQADLFDSHTGCVLHFPSFEQFLLYRTMDAKKTVDPHWATVGSLCAPCLLPYDAIIKLETAEADSSYVMSHSGLDKYATLETKHTSSENQKGATSEVREAFYSEVTCDTLQRVEALFKMDLEMFDYDVEPFYKLCKKNSV